MPKFNVYLLTATDFWKGIEAADAEAAEDMVLENEPLDCIRESATQWRLVSEEVDEDDDDEELEGADEAELENGAVQVGA